MQIAIVTAEFGENAGGLSYSCFYFTEMLRRFGYDVTLISSIYSNSIANFDNLSVPVIQNQIIICEGGYKKELKENLFFRAHIRNILSETRNIKLDFIISFGAGLNGLLASELAIIMKVPLIVLLRGSEINLSISDIKLRDSNYHCLKRASKVIALSKELLNRSKEIYFNAKIHYEVIPNRIIPCNHILFPDTTKTSFILGCGAKNVNEKKGIGNLISMIFYLSKNNNDKFKIEIAGKIDFDLLESYRALCKHFNILHLVDFIGELSREEFTDRMRTWDFYVQGSFCEGFSNSVGDYLALGKPFIISNSGFIAETIENTLSEVIFDDFIPQNMANKMLNLINNPDIDIIYQNAYNMIYPLTNDVILEARWKSTLEIRSVTLVENINQDNILSIVLHDISNESNSNLDTTNESFLSFVKRVSVSGYKLCSAKHFFSSNDRSNLIICTFDDAYSGVKEYAFPILKEFNFSATIFVCHNYMGQNNDWNFKDTKRRNHLDITDLLFLQTEGWEIGSHGLTHRSLIKLSDDDLQNEINLSKAKLEELFGEIDTYAYPYGDYNEYCKLQTSKSFKSAFALTKGGTLIGIDNFQIRRYFISEILNHLVK